MHSAYTLGIVNISTLLNIVFITLYRESYLSAQSNTDLATISTCGWLNTPAVATSVHAATRSLWKFVCSYTILIYIYILHYEPSPGLQKCAKIWQNISSSLLSQDNWISENKVIYCIRTAIVDIATGLRIHASII